MLREGRQGHQLGLPGTGICSPFSHTWQGVKGSGAMGAAQLPCLALRMFGALEQMPSALCQLAHGTHGDGGCRPAQGTATSGDSCIPQNSEGLRKTRGVTSGLPHKRTERWLEARTAAEKPVEFSSPQKRVGDQERIGPPSPIPQNGLHAPRRPHCNLSSRTSSTLFQL